MSASVRPAEPVRLSVAVVTRNRPESLAIALESLRRQSLQPHEVVVSDDSTDGFVADVQAIAERWGCRYVEGPRRGLYANRNHVALHCTGTHIRTMDDDHTLPEGHLEQCLAAVRADPGSIWTTGEVGFVDGRYHDTSPTATQLWPWGGGGAVSHPDDNWAIADGSTIYPRAVFDAGFRMVETYGFGSSYLEFGAYLYRRGCRSRCIPGALIHHHARAEDLQRGGIEIAASGLFASICYNRHFRPDFIRTVRHVARWLTGRHGLQLAGLLPGILGHAGERWACVAP